MVKHVKVDPAKILQKTVTCIDIRVFIKKVCLFYLFLSIQTQDTQVKLNIQFFKNIGVVLATWVRHPHHIPPSVKTVSHLSTDKSVFVSGIQHNTSRDSGTTHAMRNKGTDLGYELYSGPLTEDSSPWPWPMSPWRTLSQTSCHRQLSPCWKFRFSVEKFPHSGGVTKYVQMHRRRQQKQFYFTHINCPSWRFNSEPEESFLAHGISQRGRKRSEYPAHYMGHF